MNKNDLKEVDNYLKSLYNQLEESENDVKLLNEVKIVLTRVEKLKSQAKLRRILRLLGLLALIVGLMVLFWENIYIHVVYLIRLLVIMVIYYCVT